MTIAGNFLWQNFIWLPDLFGDVTFTGTKIYLKKMKKI